MNDVTQATHSESKSSSTTTHARYIFWVMFSISFVNYLDRYILTGSANVIAKELGFDLRGIGYITSAFLIFYTVCVLPMGIWADRARRKDVVALSVALGSLATASTALATNFWTLFISRMILGVGGAGYFPAGTALLSDYFSRARRSRIMSWWNCAQLIGILGGFGLGGTLAGLYLGSWRLAFLITGIPGLVLAFLIWRIHEPRRNQVDEEENRALEQETVAQEATPVVTVPRQILQQLWTLLRIPTLFVLIIMQVFAYFVLGVNTAFLPTYLQQKDTFALSSTQAGLYSGGVIVMAGIVGTLLGGYLADMLNRRHPGARVLICGIGFLLSAPAFALAVTARDLRIFTIFFVLTAFLLTIYTGPSTAATQDVVPPALRASAVSLSLLIAHMLGDAFAPSIVGVLATVFDPSHGGHFVAGRAGQDLSLALLLTCTPALVIAGLIGILGARSMVTDVAAIQQTDHVAKFKPTTDDIIITNSSERVVLQARDKLPENQGKAIIDKDTFKPKKDFMEDLQARIQVILAERDHILTIQIMEDPLTAQNLTIIISALTDLHTKCWLIQQGRFADVIEYAQTRDPHFTKEARLVIIKLTHNSPAEIKFDVGVREIAEAIGIAIDGLVQAPLRYKGVELDNQAKAVEIRIKETEALDEHSTKEQARELEIQKIELDKREKELELEAKALELEAKRLEIQEQRLELEKKRIEYALDIANKMISVLQPSADQGVKEVLARTLLPNLLQLGNSTALTLVGLPDNQEKTQK